MSNVTYISDRIGKWREIYRHADPVNGTMLTVYVNDMTKELDVVQTNDEGESITTHIGGDAALMFIANVAHSLA